MSKKKSDSDSSTATAEPKAVDIASAMRAIRDRAASAEVNRSKGYWSLVEAAAQAKARSLPPAGSTWQERNQWQASEKETSISVTPDEAARLLAEVDKTPDEFDRDVEVRSTRVRDQALIRTLPAVEERYGQISQSANELARRRLQVEQEFDQEQRKLAADLAEVEQRLHAIEDARIRLRDTAPPDAIRRSAELTGEAIRTSEARRRAEGELANARKELRDAVEANQSGKGRVEYTGLDVAKGRIESLERELDQLVRLEADLVDEGNRAMQARIDA